MKNMPRLRKSIWIELPLVLAIFALLLWLMIPHFFASQEIAKIKMLKNGMQEVA